MYSDVIKTILAARIGFDSESDDLLSEPIIGTSGRNVNGFHQLATVKNVHSAAPIDLTGPTKLVDYLISIRTQAVLEVLAAVFDEHEEYNSSADYSDIIAEKINLFDGPIGYTIAVKLLELFVSSSRKNLTERNASLTFQVLKVELEGVRNERGALLARGIVAKKEHSIRQAQKVIFPFSVVVTGNPVW